MQQPLTHQLNVTLSDEQIAQFHHDGFLAVPQISNAAEIEMMRAAYDTIFQSKAGRESGDQFDLAGTDEEGKEAALPQILNPEKFAPELWDTQARANALHIVQQLFGPDVEAHGSHAIFKPAQHGAATPWHQDEAIGVPIWNTVRCRFGFPCKMWTRATGVCSSSRVRTSWRLPNTSPSITIFAFMVWNWRPMRM